MKVLIVDDERLALESLSEMIDWSANNYNLVGCATDGEEAMQLINEYLPDIVITDIRMPVMDGIHLSKMAKVKHPQIKFVLLTAYKDFEYAQQAIRHGVTEYLLKNQINEENLLALLDRLSREIVKERADQGAIQHNYYQNHMMNIISDTQFLTKHENEMLVRVLIRVKTPFILSELSAYQPPEILLNEPDIKNLFSSNDKLEVRQIIGLGQLCWGLLLFDGSSKTRSIDTSLLDSLLQGLNTHFQDRFGKKITVLFDKGVAAADRVKESFMGMLDCSKYSIFMRQNYVEPYQHLLQRYRDTDGDHKLVESELVNIKSAIQNADSTRLHAALDEIMRYYTLPHNNLVRFRYAFKKLTDLLDQIRVKNNLSPLKQYIMRTQIDLESIFTVWEIGNWLAVEFNRLAVEIGAFPEKIKDQRIAQAVDYIHRNYINKITVKDVADYVELSEVYFGNLFKKETGYTFLEYLSEHRMNIAKYLICENNYKVYEIAEMIGYTSPQYFSQIFYKHFGCTPYEYGRKARHHEA